jgi:tetratricopeptide (TPR) repeat protein
MLRYLIKKTQICFRAISTAILFFGMTACASKFIVKSEPQQADVYILNAKGDKKIIGKTPLEIPADQVKKNFPEAVAGQFLTVIVEKQGFESQRLNIPATRFGALVTSLDVKLKQGETQAELKIAKDILDRLFLAQKFALTNQFERAHIEIDKILTPFPNFARALSMRASIYYAQKNYQESLKWYEEALKNDPQMEEAVKMTAKVRTLLGLPTGGNPNERQPANTGQGTR